MVWPLLSAICICPETTRPGRRHAADRAGRESVLILIKCHESYKCFNEPKFEVWPQRVVMGTKTGLKMRPKMRPKMGPKMEPKMGLKMGPKMGPKIGPQIRFQIGAALSADIDSVVAISKEL